mmetsp:Transcript_39227/g.124978  ORF Transcript_39227/g.124978 Transcript_39227/m.124978 type:complete len:141 (+) Transcript_39227:958-1380(+)
MDAPVGHTEMEEKGESGPLSDIFDIQWPNLPEFSVDDDSLVHQILSSAGLASDQQGPGSTPASSEVAPQFKQEGVPRHGPHGVGYHEQQQSQFFPMFVDESAPPPPPYGMGGYAMPGTAQDAGNMPSGGMGGFTRASACA